MDTLDLSLRISDIVKLRNAYTQLARAHSDVIQSLVSLRTRQREIIRGGANNLLNAASLISSVQEDIENLANTEEDTLVALLAKDTK